MTEKESDKKIGISTYVIVFAILAIIIAAAGVSTLFFNPKLATTTNVSLSSLPYNTPAPNFHSISAWINSPPLNITQLKGKVVIVDFWTYSCINCIRTIPFLDALQKEYGKDGLVIVGVSTPEFAFEHNLTNVQNAVKRFNITYAVALDNNYGTWDAYSNEYWPADYIIDRNGDIRYESFGESPADFNQTQQVVRELLENAGYTLPTAGVNVTDALNFTQEISPEMYFGWSDIETGRVNYFGNQLQPNATYNYTLPNVSRADTIYLSGIWYSAPDSLIAAGNNSRIIIVYRAKDVNMVASGNGGNSTIRVALIDNSSIQDYLGGDMKLENGRAVAVIGQSRLYNIIAAPDYRIHELEINATRGFRIYTFTFG